jgi:hypothetical protein
LVSFMVRWRPTPPPYRPRRSIVRSGMIAEAAASETL